MAVVVSKRGSGENGKDQMGTRMSRERIKSRCDRVVWGLVKIVWPRWMRVGGKGLDDVEGPSCLSPKGYDVPAHSPLSSFHARHIEIELASWKVERSKQARP